MFSKKKTLKFTQDYSDKIFKLKNKIAEADAILIGAGAGLSTSAGFTYNGTRFEKYFQDFIDKYGFKDMYSGGFFPFETYEEYWAYWSRYIYINRYIDTNDNTYRKLLDLVRDKNYFVITTNVDHQFQKNGFDKYRLFYTQGDYGLFQCSEPCCQKTFDNKEIIKKMFYTQKNMKIPSELIPECPECGKKLTVNLRADNKFVEDEGWHNAYNKYNDFLCKYKNMKILFLELGVGYNTPAIIKYPFWQMTVSNPKAFYVCINYGESMIPNQIEHQSLYIEEDIKKVIEDTLYMM